MRMTTLLSPTLRETPAEAEIESHRLMLRAGLIRKVGSGIYTHLPLGQRVIRKVEAVIREEMDAKGGQELRMPIVQPAGLWRETGRWNEYGEEMWKLRDRHQRQFCLGPTHEELITDLVRSEIDSYRQLPVLLYQIENKYRDEIRPRFGVMRSREFIMKDLYSFDVDEPSLEASYQKMDDAYRRIFNRCGLDYRVVEADSGAIGGSDTHEFMALAETGEAAIAYCKACDYAANTEKAEGVSVQINDQSLPPEAPQRIHTPGIRTIGELADYLDLAESRLTKILFYWAVEDDSEELVAVLLRGDRELNEVKLRNRLGCLQLRLASASEIWERTGAPVGSAGPIGLDGTVSLLADREVMELEHTVVGANEEDYHLSGVVPGRDFEPDDIADLRLVKAGDPCPHCGQSLSVRRGIEVGQIFKLGTKYSQTLGAFFQDEQGESRPVQMGCYGIGVTRTVAAVIEQHHDQDGIIWPVEIAPFQVVIVPIRFHEEEQRRASLELYQTLESSGFETLIDDRDERAGVKFNDAELIGIPIRLTIGPRSLEAGMVELDVRRTGESLNVPLSGAVHEVEHVLEELVSQESEKRTS